MKKDYSKIFTTKKTSKNKKTEKEDNIVREPVVVEETEKEDNIVREPVVVEETEKNKKVSNNKNLKVGIVNCNKLNVRSEPKKDSLVKTIINNGETVKILDNSDKEFYKVLTSDKVEGYCMKKFIDIK